MYVVHHNYGCYLKRILCFTLLTYSLKFSVILVVGALNAIKSSWQNVPPNWSGSDPCGSKWDGINCTNSRVTNL